MTARRIRKLRSKIRTWKVWTSSFHFDHYSDIFLFNLATPAEQNPNKDRPVIIYGLNIEEALRRYAKKFPWDTIADMNFVRTRPSFAVAAVLPNHGLHRKPCAWNLNLPKDVQYWC